MNTQSAPPQHTPGPWITSTGRVPGLGRAFGVLKESHKPGEKGESICVVCKEDNTQQHDIANAQLIASAPDLLDALKNLLPLAAKLIDEAYDRGETDYPSGNISEVIRAQAALGKSGQNSEL